MGSFFNPLHWMSGPLVGELITSLKTDSHPRPLGEDDIDSWLDSADQRKPPAMHTKASIQQSLRLSNPVRWARMQSDIRWMRKKLKKMGLNPEDAPWLLTP